MVGVVDSEILFFLDSVIDEDKFYFVLFFVGWVSGVIVEVFFVRCKLV